MAGISREMESKEICSFGNFDKEIIASAEGAEVLPQLRSQPTGLHSDGGIELGIELTRPSEDLRGDPVLLDRYSGILNCLMRQIPQQLAKRIGAVQDRTSCDLLNLE